MPTPTVTLLATFADDLSVATVGGPAAFGVTAGTPTIEAGGWGTGAWGYNGAWGSFRPGHLWLETGDAVAIDPDGRIAPSRGAIDPSSGAIAFRVTPTIETGLEELWGECGTKGSGTDHVQWGRDASTHPFVEWSSNDAAYQRLTGTETLAAGVECLFYTDWDGTIIRLSIDNGTIQTDTRDAVSDSWGAGDLVLKAE